jgi:uncharacterized membrane protein YccC
MMVVTGNPRRHRTARMHAMRDLDMISITRPALLCGVRMAASVCLALFVAFWLQLDNAYWAGASAAAVCQPTLGASFRKGWYRMIGTVLGASAIVAVTGCFVQSRAAFLVALALWGAVCGTVATLLRNFAAYGAALASTTAIVIGCDTLGAVGGPNGQTFILAVTRASEICIGIVCAGLVLAATDFGGARRRLAAQFAALLADIQKGFACTLTTPALHPEGLRAIRRELIGRVVALDPVVDQTIGESSQIRYQSSVLTRASEGLFDSLVAWQAIANHLVLLPSGLARAQAMAAKQRVSDDLAAIGQWDAPAESGLAPSSLHRLARKAIRRLIAAPTDVPSERLLLDQIAMALAGVARALLGLTLLRSDFASSISPGRRARPYIADWLPALINGSRALVTIGAAEMLWVVTGWPTGTTCIIYSGIAVVLFGPRSDAAYGSAVNFCAGAIVASLCAATVKFAVLPQLESYVSLCAVFACYLVPIGALGSLGRYPAFFGIMPVGFIALVTPANIMVYDTVSFYNGAIALVAGTVIAALAFLLLPPLSPAVRTRRLLASTLRDLRRVATGHESCGSREWRRRIYARLAALPDSASPVERAHLSAAVTAGTELIRLRRATRTLSIGSDLQPAYREIAEGSCAGATHALARADRRLASLSLEGRRLALATRARASILALTELIDRHAAYFCAGALP